MHMSVLRCILDLREDVLDFLCHSCTSIVANRVHKRTTYHSEINKTAQNSSTGSLTICIKRVSEGQLVAEISIKYNT
jgi:hypothetical protein